MRIGLCRSLLVVVLVGLPGLALASTDLEKFEGRVGKSAPSIGDVTPPVVCVCKDGSGNQNRAGQLIQVREPDSGHFFVHVVCYVEQFDSAGSFTLAFACPTWELLPK